MNNQAIVVKNKENINKISEFSWFVYASVEYELRTERICHETQQYSNIS